MTATASSAPKRILLIDDDELIASSLRQYLVMQSCDVDVAHDGNEAGKLLAGERYDVVIVDPYLTGGVHHDSGQLLDDVLRLQHDAAMIVLTAYSSPELALNAAACNATSVLTKPQSVVTLNDLVMNVLRAPKAAGGAENALLKG